MQLYVLSLGYINLGIIPDYISLSWTERFYEIGEFELKLSYNSEMQSLIHLDRIIKRSDSKQMMLIERIEIQTSEDEGDVMTISGRDVGCLLDRRIVYKRYQIAAQSYPIQTITTLINAMLVDNHKLPYFTVDTSDNTSISTSDKIYEQFLGESLSDVLIEYAKTYVFGWHVEYSPDGNRGSAVLKFDFSTDKGDTLSQLKNQINNVRIVKDNTEYRNAGICAGEYQDEERIREIYVSDNPSGLDRYETYVDGSDISDSTTDMDSAMYNNMLWRKGIGELKSMKVNKNYCDGECNNLPSRILVGDIVTLENAYGDNGKAKILEITDVFDETGHTRIPSFEISE